MRLYERRVYDRKPYLVQIKYNMRYLSGINFDLIE